MLSTYVTDCRARDRLRRGAAGPYLDDFSDWLAGRGYGRATIGTYLRAAARFAAWAQLNQRPVPAGLDPASLGAYRAHGQQWTPRRGRSRRDPGNRSCGARTFGRFLRARGHAADDPAATPALLHRFEHWMRQHRGVGDVTLAGYGRVLRRLLGTLGAEARGYTAAQLRAFVLQQAQGFSHSQAETVLTLTEIRSRLDTAGEDPPRAARRPSRPRNL